MILVIPVKVSGSMLIFDKTILFSFRPISIYLQFFVYFMLDNWSEIPNIPFAEEYMCNL